MAENKSVKSKAGAAAPTRRAMVHWRVEPYRSRMVKAVKLVRRHGLPTKQVAEKFGIPPRTLRRYVSDPSRLGFRIEDTLARTQHSSTDNSAAGLVSHLLDLDGSNNGATGDGLAMRGGFLSDPAKAEDLDGDMKNAINHSRRWTVEPYRSQMLKAILMIKHKGLPTTKVANECGIPPRTLRRYLNNTIKLQKMLQSTEAKQQGDTHSHSASSLLHNVTGGDVDPDACALARDEINVACVLDLMSIGHTRGQRRSRSSSMVHATNSQGLRPRAFSLDSHWTLDGVMGMLNSNNDNDSGPTLVPNVLTTPTPRGAPMSGDVQWRRPRSLSCESLEVRGQQLQMLNGAETAAVAQQLLSIHPRRGDLCAGKPPLHHYSHSPPRTLEPAGKTPLRPSRAHETTVYKHGGTVMVRLAAADGELAGGPQRWIEASVVGEKEAADDDHTTTVGGRRRSGGGRTVEVTYATPRDGDVRRWLKECVSPGIMGIVGTGSDECLQRSSCEWAPVIDGTPGVFTIVHTHTDNVGRRSLTPDNATGTCASRRANGNAITGRKRAMSWSAGDASSSSISSYSSASHSLASAAKQPRGRSNSIACHGRTDPRIIASAFILTQIACPALPSAW